jgi:hypothetical protein
MRNSVFIFLISIFLAFPWLVDAQTSEPNSAVFMEILGNGLVYSFNYDTRFSAKQDGLGGRVGISYLAIEGTSIATVPMVMNYLLGKNGKYFEMGIGATYVAAADRTNTNSRNNPINTADGWLGTMSFGYRSQPVDGGFLFRAGVTPLFGGGSFWPFYPQVSFGYAF